MSRQGRDHLSLVERRIFRLIATGSFLLAVGLFVASAQDEPVQTWALVGSALSGAGCVLFGLGSALDVRVVSWFRDW